MYSAALPVPKNLLLFLYKSCCAVGCPVGKRLGGGGSNPNARWSVHYCVMLIMITVDDAVDYCMLLHDGEGYVLVVFFPVFC